MNITIINQHTSNYGDDAAGVALLEQLNETFPTAKIHIVYNQSVARSGLLPFTGSNVIHHSLLTLNKRDLPSVIKYLAYKLIDKRPHTNDNISSYLALIRDSNYVIVSPCGANIGIYRDWFFLFRVLAAILENRQVYFHMNTIDRSGHVTFDMISKYVLARANVFVREYKSYIDLQSWGLKSTLGVDTAFNLPSAQTKSSPAPYLAFIPTKLEGWHPHFQDFDSLGFIASVLIPGLTKFSQSLNVPIRILPHLHGSQQEGRLLEDVHASLGRWGVSSTIERPDSFVDYQNVIAQSELTVSMRYHGIVLAANNAVPFVSLSYENKMHEVSQYCGLRHYSAKIEDVDEHNFLLLLNEVWRKRHYIREHLDQRVQGLKSFASLPVRQMYLRELHRQEAFELEPEVLQPDYGNRT